MTESEERHLNVILEDINGKFDLVLEGHAALDEKMERFHKEAKGDHRLAMDLIKYSHDELKEEIQGVQTELKEEIQGVRTELKETRVELSVKIEAVGDKVNGIDARDSALGHKVNGIDARDSALGHKVEGHEDRIRFLERKVA